MVDIHTWVQARLGVGRGHRHLTWDIELNIEKMKTIVIFIVRDKDVRVVVKQKNDEIWNFSHEAGGQDY